LYVRHRTERTLLNQFVEECYPTLKPHLVARGTALPGHVEQELEGHLKHVRLDHGLDVETFFASVENETTSIVVCPWIIH
jgi:hypothetical protein